MHLCNLKNNNVLYRCHIICTADCREIAINQKIGKLLFVLIPTTCTNDARLIKNSLWFIFFFPDHVKINFVKEIIISFVFRESDV